MIKKISDKAKAILFQKMLSINQIQFNSFIITAFILLTKSIFGTYLIMFIYFQNEVTLFNDALNIKYRFIQQLSEQNSYKYSISFIYLFIHVIIFLLFLNPKKQSFCICNKILLVILTLFQTFKFMSIILVCTTLYGTIVRKDIVFVLINTVNFIFIMIWSIVFQNFYYTLNYDKKNYLAKFHSSLYQICQVILMVTVSIFIFIGKDQLNYMYKIVYNLIFLLFRITIIYSNLLKWKYVNRMFQCIYSFLTMTECIALLFNLIVQFTNQYLLKTNFYLSTLSTSVFCFIAWKAYFDWNQEDIYFSEGKQIKASDKAVMYFKALYQISISAQGLNSNSVIISSIRKQHQIKCTMSNCYCKSKIQNQNFVRHYIIEQLSSLRGNFKNNPQILIQELNFRFHMFQVYPDILTKLSTIKHHFSLNITNQFSLLTLKNDLINWMQQKNIKHHTIDVETPLKLEQITKDMQSIIKSDIQRKNKKWKYLSRALCRIQQLQQDTQFQINCLKNITKIHHLWIEKFKRSSLFNFLLLFHYKKISFLNVKIQDIQKNLRQNFKKIKEQQLSSTKQFAKCIFHKRSCLIQSMIDQQNMSIVSRSSKNIYEMFGYQQNKVVGMNVNRLMPNFIGIQHDKILQDWLKSGSWRTVGKLKQIFCIHRQEFCFAALIYLKIVANQKGLFFVTVVFKKNQSDYLILNPKQEIQGIGRKFLHLIGANCRKIPIKLLVSDFPSQQTIPRDQYKSFIRQFKSFKSNQALVQQYLQQKNSHPPSIQQQTKFINEYKAKLDNAQHLQTWQVKFDIKIYQMRQVHFYVVLLNYAKVVQPQCKKTLNTLFDQSRYGVIIGHGRMNQDQDRELQSSNNASQQTVRQKNQQFYDQKNSSMASFTERQSFTLTKLLSIFYFYLIHPKQIKDKRINTLNISTLLQTLILSSIICVSFFIYERSLSEVKSYISANSQINQNMQMSILMFNKAISMSQYQNQTQTLNSYLTFVRKDLDEFYNSTQNHLLKFNSLTSQLHNQRLYQYLNSKVQYVYQRKKSTEVSVLQFFQYYYYLTMVVSHDVMTIKNLDVIKLRQYELDRIKQNFPQVKQLTSNVGNIFIELVSKSRNNLILVAWLVMTSFFIITFVFFLYTYNYYHFRYNQVYQTLQIYKIISPQLIDKVKQYYVAIYTQIFISSNKNSTIQNNFQNLNQIQLISQECKSYLHNNKIKFFGKQKFTGWIKSFLLFLVINSINMLITYEVVRFVDPLDSFMKSINGIIDSQNKVFQTYLDIKSAYLLAHTPKINTTIIDSMLSLMNQNQVTFNEMVTFQSELLSKYDPGFYNDFYQTLVNNICNEIKSNLENYQYQNCMNLSKTTMIQQGVITYMNNFQRRLRSVLQDLKANSTVRFSTQGRYYFMNRGFKQIDMTMTYNIRIFRKLIDRILLGYEKGVSYIKGFNIIILIILIAPQVVGLLLWFHLDKRQKKNLSQLYGSMLMIPPPIVKQVKNMPKISKKILQFKQT